MRKALYIILVFSILSCSNSKKSDAKPSEQNKIPENQIEKIIEKRFLYVFDIDYLKTEMEYELTTERSDSLVIYHYKNLTNSEKNMDFKFIRKTKQLFFSGTEFELIKEDHYSENKLSELNFDLYVLNEPVDDGNGPMFFNPNYGILNLDNGWGKRFLYLKKDKETEFAKKLIKILEEKTFYNNVYN